MKFVPSDRAQLDTLLKSDIFNAFRTEEDDESNKDATLIKLKCDLLKYDSDTGKRIEFSTSNLLSSVYKAVSKVQ